VRRSTLDETRLEIQERLVRFEVEGGNCAIVADRDRLEALVPVLLGAEHHAAAPGRVGDPQGSGERALGPIEAGLARATHSWNLQPLSTHQWLGGQARSFVEFSVEFPTSCSSDLATKHTATGWSPQRPGQTMPRCSAW
jgi:hypothetical protein